STIKPKWTNATADHLLLLPKAVLEVRDNQSQALVLISSQYQGIRLRGQRQITARGGTPGLMSGQMGRGPEEQVFRSRGLVDRGVEERAVSGIESGSGDHTRRGPRRLISGSTTLKQRESWPKLQLPHPRITTVPARTRRHSRPPSPPCPRGAEPFATLERNSRRTW